MSEWLEGLGGWVLLIAVGVGLVFHLLQMYSWQREKANLPDEIRNNHYALHGARFASRKYGWGAFACGFWVTLFGFIGLAFIFAILGV